MRQCSLTGAACTTILFILGGGLTYRSRLFGSVWASGIEQGDNFYDAPKSCQGTVTVSVQRERCHQIFPSTNHRTRVMCPTACHKE